MKILTKIFYLFVTFIVKIISTQVVKDPEFLITMITPSTLIHGTKSWINSNNFLNDLHLTQKGRQTMFNKGLDLKKRYNFLKNIHHREIYAESCDLNYTISATNAFMMGIYNPFGKGGELPFENDDPKILPPEPLSFDPKKLIKFNTALPFGARFIPVYTSSGHHDLRFMLADETCPTWKKTSKDILFKANEKFQKSKVFKSNLLKVEEYLNLDDVKTFTAESNRSLIEKCYRLKLKYNDVVDSEFENLKERKNQKLSKSLEEFLENCESYYWLLKFDNKKYSKLQATPVNDLVVKLMTNIIEEQTNTKKPKPGKPKKKKAALKRRLKFTLIGGHMAHLISQLSNLKYFKDQRKVYFKLLTTSNSEKYKSLMLERKPLPEPASSLNWELHRSDSGQYSIRMIYNSEPIDFCEIENQNENYLCPVDKFKARVASLSNHSFKTQCGMHLKYKIPELMNSTSSTFVPNLILGILVVLTIVFALLGWSIRKRYKHLNEMINRELGSIDKRNE